MFGIGIWRQKHFNIGFKSIPQKHGRFQDTYRQLADDSDLDRKHGGALGLSAIVKVFFFIIKRISISDIIFL